MCVPSIMSNQPIKSKPSARGLVDDVLEAVEVEDGRSWNLISLAQLLSTISQGRLPMIHDE